MLRRREESVRIARGEEDQRQRKGEKLVGYARRRTTPKTHGHLHRVRYPLVSLSAWPAIPEFKRVHDPYTSHRTKRGPVRKRLHARQRDGPSTYFGYLPLFICLDESRSRHEFSLFSRRGTGIVWFANSGIDPQRSSNSRTQLSRDGNQPWCSNEISILYSFSLYFSLQIFYIHNKTCLSENI